MIVNNNQSYLFFFNSSVRQNQSTAGVDIDAEPISILHPDIGKS